MIRSLREVVNNMKKWVKAHKETVYIVLIIVALLVVIILGVLLAPEKKDNPKSNNNYHFTNEVKEIEGTVEYSTDDLKKDHCIDDICISDATFYYLGDEGRIDYVVTNNSSSKKSGSYKMVFGDEYLVVYFTDIEPGKSFKTTSQYIGKTIPNMDDYTLDYLTDEEQSKIIVSNY